MSDDRTTRPDPEPGSTGSPPAEDAGPVGAATEASTADGPAAPGPTPDAQGTQAAPPILDQVTSATEDLARRAAPTVRQVGARAAVVAAELAEASAPLLQRAATASAGLSLRLAERARAFAAELERDSADVPPRPATGEGEAPGPAAEPAAEAPQTIEPTAEATRTSPEAAEGGEPGTPRILDS